jgi:DNA-binding CsgD family transcriptional regulator
MTPKMKQKVARLFSSGKSEKDIASILKVHRNTVYRAQKAMGLSLHRPGIRCPEISPEQKTEVLRLLRDGMSQAKTSNALGVRIHAVRRIYEENGFHRVRGHKLTPAQWLQVREDILARKNYATDIASKRHVPYKTVLKIAHEVLGVRKFLGGHGQPLNSPFPLRPRTFPFFAEVLANQYVHPGTDAELICNAALQTIHPTKEEIDADPRVTDEFFAEVQKEFKARLLGALQSQIDFHALRASALVN